MLARARLLSFLLLISSVTVSSFAYSVNTANPMDPGSSNKPGYNPSAFNPAMGLVLDAAASNTTANRGNLDFRSAELSLMAAVDPFATLYASINGTKDEVEVEEAAFMTTALPYNMTVRGGRFFANFGRLPHWHDHELPFVNRTESLETFFDGEARADGVEVIHLFKTPFFLQGTLGAYNKMGSENTRLNETGGTGHANGRPGASFTYLGRLFSYVPLGDNFGIDLGASQALTPRQYYIDGVRQDSLHSARSLTGVDITFRFEPLEKNTYRKLLWGTEVFRNDELRQTGTIERKRAWAGYSYVDWRFAQRWSGGGFVDLAENINTPALVTRTIGTMVTFHPSDFQRIRLQVSQKRANSGSPADDQVFLQWIGSIGRHVHVFKDR